MIFLEWAVQQSTSPSPPTHFIVLHLSVHLYFESVNLKQLSSFFLIRVTRVSLQHTQNVSETTCFSTTLLHLDTVVTVPPFEFGISPCYNGGILARKELLKLLKLWIPFSLSAQILSAKRNNVKKVRIRCAHWLIILSKKNLARSPELFDNFLEFAEVSHVEVEFTKLAICLEPEPLVLCILNQALLWSIN